MNKKENIILDASIVNVIGHAAFNAVLSNGYSFVAYCSGADRRLSVELGQGAAIRVEMSPYDMTKGRILLRNSGSKDES